MLVCALIGIPARALAAPAEPTDDGSFVQGEKTLESRLMAPCCWNQTLDVHESEVTRALRAEIRRRLRAGESAERIEADLVERYGPRIRAVPAGASLTGIAVWVSAGVVLSGLGAALLVVRWARRGKKDDAPKKQPAGEQGTRDAWDDRLDAEVDDLPD